METVRVLSLFDGIACTKLALNKLKIKHEYFSSEVEPNAIKVVEENWGDTVTHLGDVEEFEGWETPQIDLLIGGSPCSGFSSAGLRTNFEHDQSRLFFHYIKILRKLKPKYFLLENVCMKKEWEDTISGYLGYLPYKLSSGLVSAQDRNRNYWTNIPVEYLPKDKGISFEDIIEENPEEPYYIHDKYFKGDEFNNRIKEKRTGKRGKEQECFAWSRSTRKIDGESIIKDRFRKDNKSHTLVTGEGCSIFSGANLVLTRDKLRFLTPVECERLQTIPDNYTNCLSRNKRYEVIGNAFTVDMISHILSFANLDKEARKQDPVLDQSKTPLFIDWIIRQGYKLEETVTSWEAIRIRIDGKLFLYYYSGKTLLLKCGSKKAKNLLSDFVNSNNMLTDL